MKLEFMWCGKNYDGSDSGCRKQQKL